MNGWWWVVLFLLVVGSITIILFYYTGERSDYIRNDVSCEELLQNIQTQRDAPRNDLITRSWIANECWK